MRRHQVLLDSFADARRTWGDLLAFALEALAGRDRLSASDLAELDRRVEAHRAAIDLLADALVTETADDELAGGGARSRRARSGSPRSTAEEQHTGISNRESPREEDLERREHPPIEESPPPPEDAAGRRGEPLDEPRDVHTSHKAGLTSFAQKEDEARYLEEPVPPARKVAGAFGKER